MIIDSALCPFTSGELCTFLWSMIPLLEMRAAVPLGMLQFNLGFWETVFFSFWGGFVATVFCLWFLPTILRFLERFLPPIHKFVFEKIISRTRAKHSKKMEVIGEMFLVTFVAIPLPGSGAFTGAVLAYLFGVPFWRALLLVSIGVLGSNIIMAVLTISGENLWDWVANFFI
ncbi:MAG TPA: small multi-drug export protein [Candidatus Gracilibacteria bacterium]